MNEISDIIVYMAPWPIYEKIGWVATYVAGLLTPVLLIFAILFRTLETQLDGFEGNAKWASATKDFFLWGSVLTLYFLIGNMLTDFFNTIYAALAASESVGGLGGSLSAITNKLQMYIQQAEQFIADENGLWDTLTMAAGTGALAIGYFCYYITLVALAFFTIFLRLAFALGFGLVFIWGLIVIPLAITSNIKLIKGWGIFAGGILLWPIIESVMIALLIPVFDVGIASLMNSYESANATKGGIYAIFSILNLVLIAIMLAAPFVASALAANSSALGGLVMPFAAASLAATSAAGGYMLRKGGRGVEKSLTSTGQWGGSKTLEAGRWAGNNINDMFKSSSSGKTTGTGGENDWPNIKDSYNWHQDSGVVQGSSPTPSKNFQAQQTPSASNSGESPNTNQVKQSPTKSDSTGESNKAEKSQKSDARKQKEHEFFRNKNANFKRGG